jgi:hypothetical protein
VGRGSWDGVGGGGMALATFFAVVVVEVEALDSGLRFAFEAGAGGCDESSVRSVTFGIPEWGPRRFLIESKCSQS